MLAGGSGPVSRLAVSCPPGPRLCQVRYLVLVEDDFFILTDLNHVEIENSAGRRLYPVVIGNFTGLTGVRAQGRFSDGQALLLDRLNNDFLANTIYCWHTPAPVGYALT